MRKNEAGPRRWRRVAITAIGLVLPFQGGCACGCGAGLSRGSPGRGSGPVCAAVLGPPPAVNDAPPPVSGWPGPLPNGLGS